MSASLSAEVFVGGVPAGLLIKTAAGYLFRYYDSYLAAGELPPVSLTLPKRKEEYISETLFPFFFGMIPEGENKLILCRSQKIDPHDYFDLLTESASEESIGSVTIRKRA